MDLSIYQRDDPDTLAQIAFLDLNRANKDPDVVLLRAFCGGQQSRQDDEFFNAVQKEQKKHAELKKT
jgi:hypothetical protein